MATKDYEEQLFESMKVIAEKCVKAINYDATKQAEIVDDTGKAQGWYQVKIDGTVTCKAHPIDKDTEYKTGDKVVILIPNNDINEQKIILSKWADESADAYVYESPMESMVDVTGNLIDNTIKLSTDGLVANDQYNSTTLDPFSKERYINEHDEEQPGSWRHLGTIKNDNFPLIGYSILGLKANFRTLLSQCVEGDYGLRLRLTCAPPQETAPYNGALDVFEQFKSACLEFVNLYMIANKTGAINKANLFERISNNDSNKNLNNKLYVQIYWAYLRVITTLNDLINNTNFAKSINDGGIIYSLTDFSRLINWLRATDTSDMTLLAQCWLLEALYTLEQGEINENINIILGQNTIITYDPDVEKYYYKSAGVVYEWTPTADSIAAITPGAKRTALELNWVNCYRWLLLACTDFVNYRNEHPYIERNTSDDAGMNEVIIHWKSGGDIIKPLTEIKFNNCNIADFNNYLLQNNKITKQGTATVAINPATGNTQLQNIMVVDMYLTPKEMIGAIYNCPDGYTQEAIFPIENLGAIYSIEIDLYERPGSFYYFNNDGELIPYPYLYKDANDLNASAIQDILIENAWGNAIEPGYLPVNNQFESQRRIADNIFVDNIYICAGYKKDYYNEEQAILYTKNSDKYSKDNLDLKYISVRWIHKNEETEKFNIIKVNDFDDTQYKIQWYQQDFMSSGDKWVGNNWKHLFDFDNKFNCSFTPRVNDYQKELIRCIILAGSMDNNTFVPTEIVVKSNILTFENETDLAKTKLEEINLTEGLNIICEDGSNGAYFVYDEMFKTVNKAFHTKQKLSLVINNQAIDTAVDINELPKVAAVDSIEWIIPVNNSMIKFYWDNDLITKDFVLNNEYYKSQQILLEGTSNDNNQRVDKIKIISKQTITGEDNLYKLYYQIPQTYNPDKKDNTVMCTVKLPNDKYTMATKLSFMLGQESTNGYPYSLVVSFANMENQALIADRNTDSIEFNLSIRDINNNKWLSLNTNNVLFESLQDDPDILVPFYDIEAVSNSQQNNEITTLKITYTPLGRVSFYKAYIITIGYKVTNNIQLITKIPIPVQMDSSYNRLIYAPSPIINYNSDGSLSGNPLFKYSYNNENPIGQFELQRLIGTNVQPETSVADIGWIENNIFHPHPFYVQQANFYGIVCKINGYRQWQCPIIRQEYQYPYAALNKWNGQDIVIDNEGGHVIAPRIGAGKKNDDNTFSGVILGDWADDSELDGQKLTGLYGLRSGLMTYGFKEDGTAFIGPSGSGRILFDGANGVIKSNSYSTWSNSTLPTDSSNNLPNSGMYINFSRGQLYANGLSGSIKINPNDNSSLFTISAKPFTETVYEPLMQVGLQSFYLKSWNFSNWNQATGHTYGDTDWLNEKYGMYTVTYGSPDAGGFLDITYTNIATRSASTATHIPSNNKKITVLNQEVDLTDSPVAFQVGPTGSYFNLQTGLLYTKNGYFCGDVYAKNGYFNGTVYATAGEIGGCTIDNGTLIVTNANIRGNLTANSLTITKGGYTVFDAQPNSNLSLGGWSINESRLVSKNYPYVGMCSGQNNPTNPTYAFYAGATDSYGNNAKFLVSHDGSVIAKNILLDGALTIGSSATDGINIYAQNAMLSTIKEVETLYGKTPSSVTSASLTFKWELINPSSTTWSLLFTRLNSTNWTSNRLRDIINNIIAKAMTASGEIRDITWQSLKESSWNNDTISYSLTSAQAESLLYIMITGKGSVVHQEGHIITIEVSKADTAYSDITIYGSLIPGDIVSSASLYSLGGSACKWKTAYVEGAVWNGSSRFIKQNIDSIANSYNMFFNHLLPRSFNYKNNNTKNQHKGFIIDEVCAAATSAHLDPEDCGVLFSNDTKDPYDPDASLCYNDFIALNTWQIQLLKQKVKTLEDKIQWLEDKLNEN